MLDVKSFFFLSVDLIVCEIPQISMNGEKIKNLKQTRTKLLLLFGVVRFMKSVFTERHTQQ